VIDCIRGQILYKTLDYFVVETGGVGYRVFCANPFQWPEEGEIWVHTHQVVREDALMLYGFQQAEERDLFRLLLEVSGIGPKGALAIVGTGNPGALVQAVEREDIRFLTKLPGIGKKTAQRLILDLKDKLEKAGFTQKFGGGHAETAVSSPPSDQMREAIEGLKALGYNEEEATWAVEQAKADFDGKEAGLDEWIRKALQVSMSQK
jgi:holliday junction DNA helicase RuvA